MKRGETAGPRGQTGRGLFVGQGASNNGMDRSARYEFLNLHEYYVARPVIPALDALICSGLR
jgi:hypothetical protein